MVRVYGAYYKLTKNDLITAATLKLETTSNNYSDIFTVTAKAFGSKINKKKTTGRAKTKSLPKAGFDAMATFIGAM